MCDFGLTAVVQVRHVLYSLIFKILGTSLKYVPFDLPFEEFIGDRLHEIRNDWQYAIEIVTKMLAEKGV